MFEFFKIFLMSLRLYFFTMPKWSFIEFTPTKIVSSTLIIASLILINMHLFMVFLPLLSVVTYKSPQSEVLPCAETST